MKRNQTIGMPTFIIDNNIGLSKPLEFSKEDEHHILNVLRLKSGECIQVTDNRGTLASAKLITRNPLNFEITNLTKLNPPKDITLYLSLIDQDRLEWCIQKLTELNIDKIQLMISERSQQKSLSDKKLNRLLSIALSAQKQCGRAWPVKIELPIPLKNIQFRTDTGYFFGSMQTEKNPHTQSLDASKPVCIFIGPEGGFTTEEIESFKNQNAIPIHLGETVLRSETAALALAVLVLFQG